MTDRRRLRALTFVLVAFCTLFAAAAPLSAQFGIRGGMNLSKFVGGDAGTDADRGVSLGASIPLLHLGPISIVPEVYYSKKGGTMEDLVAGSFDVDLTYLEVPVLAKLTFPLGGSLKGYLAGGPAYAWNLECHFTPTSNPSATAQECGQQFSSFSTAMKDADKGVVLNAGLNLPILFGIGGLNLDGRLVRGLDRVTESSNGSEVKNQAVTLMLGWYLGDDAGARARDG